MSGLRRVSPPWRIISVCVISVSSPPEIPAACESGVRIDEVLADPAPGIEGDANGDGTRHTYEDEFVEILNLGPVDLSGWRLGDDDTSIPSWFKFPAASLLAPGARALVFGGGAPTGFAAAAFVDDGRLGNGLSNGGDVLFLIDAAGDTIDSVPVSRFGRSSTGRMGETTLQHSTGFPPTQPFCKSILRARFTRCRKVLRACDRNSVAEPVRRLKSRSRSRLYLNRRRI